MTNKKYYSLRKGLNKSQIEIDLDLLKKLFFASFKSLLNEGYFQECMGYQCVDEGDIDGTWGSDIEIFFFKKLRKPNLWPIYEKYIEYSEEDLFDVIELLHDYISKPIKGRYHGWDDCGWHYYEFNKLEGQKKYREEFNDFLKDYNNRYEISDSGEILELGEPGLEKLLKAEFPTYKPKKVEDRVYAAINKFLRYQSSIDDKRDAVKSLADVLEYLRPKLKSVITSKDENDLFNIANNFGIRHHNDKQKTDYDESIWLSWMFYFYLITIHTIIRRLIIEKVKL